MSLQKALTNRSASTRSKTDCSNSPMPACYVAGVARDLGFVGIKWDFVDLILDKIVVETRDNGTF